MFRILGGDVINMSTVPEVILARELGLCYQTIAMGTDYDCWKEHSADEVTVETVVSNMKKNSFNAKTMITRILPLITRNRSCKCSESLNGAIMTKPESISPETRKKLSLLIDGRV